MRGAYGVRIARRGGGGGGEVIGGRGDSSVGVCGW